MGTPFEVAYELTNEVGKKYLSALKSEIVETVNTEYGERNFFHIVDSSGIVYYMPRDNGSGCVAGIWGNLEQFRHYQKTKKCSAS